MLFEDNDFDMNLALFLPDFEITRDANILSPMEGFLRGNAFANEYEPYKNLTYFKLVPKNDKERVLYQIMALNFIITDLNFYLDLHPDKIEVFNLFKKYIKEKEDLCKEYTKKYGPLKLSDATGDRFNWLNSPWPWDNEGGSLYV